MSIWYKGHPFPNRPRPRHDSKEMINYALTEPTPLFRKQVLSVHERGFVLIPHLFDGEMIDEMMTTLDRHLPIDDAAVRAGDAVYAARDLLRLCPTVIEWWQQPALVELVRAVLGDEAGLVRGVLFDKPPEQSWAVPWHKDRSIVIRPPKQLSDRYSPPRLKAGIWHCEPPESVPQRMLSLRIHLDASTAENGPLSVVAGSHQPGPRGEVVELLAQPGDVIAMRPLIDHSSPRSQPGSMAHRRVIHLEFAADPHLPDGYQWHEFHPVCPATTSQSEAA